MTIMSLIHNTLVAAYMRRGLARAAALVSPMARTETIGSSTTVGDGQAEAMRRAPRPSR